MNPADFEKAREELKELARNSVFFSFILQPDYMKRFEDELDKEIQSSENERTIFRLIDMFKEEKKVAHEAAVLIAEVMNLPVQKSQK